MAANLLDIVQRLEKVVNHFEGLVGVNPSGAIGTPAIQSSSEVKVPQQSVTSPALQAYDQNILSKFQNILSSAASIDQQIKNIVNNI